MDMLFDFLNKNSGALSVLFSAVVTLATVAYAMLTWKLVEETRLLREAQTEPCIEVTAQPFEAALNLIRLQVRNTGMGAARRLRFRASVISGGEAAARMLDEMTTPSFFKEGIDYFGPGQARFSAHTDLRTDFDGKIDACLEVKVRYESLTGQRCKKSAIISMAEWKGAEQLGTPGIYRIANSIEKIQKSVGELSSGFRRLKADVYTHADRERANGELRQRHIAAQGESAQEQQSSSGLPQPPEGPDT